MFDILFLHEIATNCKISLILSNNKLSIVDQNPGMHVCLFNNKNPFASLAQMKEFYI